MIDISNAIHVWLLDKEKLSPLSFNWKSVLSFEEQERANRFHFDNDKQSFTLYHACKRIILAQYLNASPNEIEISFKDKGKPFLKDAPITFNLSHTKEMALLAVSHNIEIGIDIEKIKDTDNFMPIAKRFFHPNEYQAIEKINDREQQLTYFFKLWTAKEAILKATGEGISGGLERFFINLDSSQATELKHSHLNTIKLFSLQTPTSYVAHLAMMGVSRPIFYKNFSLSEIIHER